VKEATLLGVGLDWAEDYHDVALGLPGKGVIEQFRIEHGPAGVARLVARCLAVEPDPAEVRVVLETRHGLLVEALVDAGFTVLPVNPDLVARRRGPAKKKDDAEDARICCLLALDQFVELRRLIPHGELGAELRAIARDDDRAARDERRLGNRLRADLLAVFPAAVDIADGDLGLGGVPATAATLAQCRRTGRRRPRRGRSPGPRQQHGWPDRFAERVITALAVPRLPIRPELAEPRLAASDWPPRNCCCCASSGGLAPADGRTAAGRSAPRPHQPTQGPPAGERVPWRRDLPEHARPG
jgi:hypothetical protein